MILCRIKGIQVASSDLLDMYLHPSNQTKTTQPKICERLRTEKSSQLQHRGGTSSYAHFGSALPGSIHVAVRSPCFRAIRASLQPAVAACRHILSGPLGQRQRRPESWSCSTRSNPFAFEGTFPDPDMTPVSGPRTRGSLSLGRNESTHSSLQRSWISDHASDLP